MPQHRSTPLRLALLEVWIQLSRNYGLPSLGKLDRIVGQIEQHLTQPQRIADQPGRYILTDRKPQPQSLVPGLQADHTRQVVENPVDFKVNRLDVELAGLDLGKIQDVVEYLTATTSAGRFLWLFC